MSEAIENKQQNKRSLGRRLLRITFRLILILFLLIFVLMALLRMPAVQKWGALHIAEYLTEKLGTEVQVNGFRINWTDNAEIRGVLIRDLDRDTMIYSSVVELDFDKPIRNLRNGNPVVASIGLEDTYLNIKFLKDDWYNNLDQVFKGKRGKIDSTLQTNINTSNVKNSGPSLFFELDEIDLKKVRVRNYNEIRGKEELFYIGEGKLEGAIFSPDSNQMITELLVLDDFRVDIENFVYDENRFYEVFVQPYESDTTEYNDEFPFNLTAKKALISNSRLKLRNYRNSPEKLTGPNELDWDHLDLYAIGIDADSFYMKDWIFGGQLNQLQAQSQTGFNLVNGAADNIRVTEQLADVKGLVLETSMSSMHGDLKFIYDEYPDFRDFENKVRFDFQSDNSELGIEDLMTFSKGIRTNPFFLKNNLELIDINGRILGYVNNLKGRSLYLRVGNQFVVNGLIDVRDFTDTDKTRINFDLKSLKTNMRTIKELLPDVKIPDQWTTLGNINLEGEFNGLLKDFIAFGRLNTDIGSAAFNMQLNFSGKLSEATYKGVLNLRDFDLGRWTSNPNFGKMSLNTFITQGKGMTSQSASGQLGAEVLSFDFKGYEYKNVNFTGLLKDRLINGTFDIKDDNIDLTGNGRIEIGESPHIDVTGKLGYIDLKALNLYEENLILSSNFNVDIRDVNPDRFTGDIFLSDVAIGKRIDSLTRLDTISISSVYTGDSIKLFNIYSDLLKASFEGDFRILSLPNYFTNYFLLHNPKLSEKLGLKEKENLPNGKFSMKLDIDDTGGLLEHFKLPFDSLQYFHIEGEFDQRNGFKIRGNLPNLRLKNMTLDNLYFYVYADGDYTNIVASHEGMKTGKIYWSPLTVFADIERDTLLYVLNEVNFQSYIDQMNIEGKIYVHDDHWQTQLYNSELNIFGDDWVVSDNNFIRFGKDKLLVRNLNLSHNDEFIKIKSINKDKGMAIELNNLPLDRLNQTINYDKIIFDGVLSGTARTNSTRTLEGLTFDLTVPKLLINGDDFGKFRTNAKSDGTNQPYDVDLTLKNGKQQLIGKAEVIPANNGEKAKIKANLDVDQYPAKIIEYFVSNGLSNTTGLVDMDLTAVGDLNDPNLDGVLNIPKTTFTIDILGTTYSLEKQQVKVTSDLIDCTDVILFDKYGNRAKVVGGLTHHNLAGLGFNARLESDEILVLDTKKTNEDLYYGTCFADIEAYFSGTTIKPVIYIQAQNKANSSFVINNDVEERSAGLDFIVFDFDTVNQTGISETPPLGVDLTIDMIINPEMDIKIILDEATRDIMSGRGSGDLVFKYSPAGEMSLFGDYKIDYGEYLFTYSVGGLVPVNKPFIVDGGSTLSWTDDPFEADVDIKAQYRLSASPYNLIGGGFDTRTEEEARQKTEVVLTLIMRGPMLRPELSFDIEMPELTGTLNNAAEIELARIRTDQTEMQSQAASLIVFREFARAEYEADASVAAVANTISEWLSNQVSYYLTGLVSNLINDVGFIDDIQFDVGYRLPSNEFATVGSVTSELGLSTKIIMFDRRLEASIKGDYVNSQDQAQGSQNFFNTDISFDYILTKDRRWRLRVYSKQDQFLNDRRTRTGVGITWRREYDNLEEFKEAVRELSRLKKEEGEVN